ncbi:hypothetical protein OS493_021961 [Desmophyllum pertusum]|uniref:CHAT domain-containing protein n=1 Tax=Desmophyllum pertusum TaxID=174260 RepID=A0A9X0CYY7_9CNID|nr:hypothetical protein OS493_021961 [Desmophyllum pertusum]
MLQSEDVLNSLKGLEHMFASGCPTNTDDENNLSWDFPYKTKEKVTQDRITLQCDEVAPERESHGDVESGKSLNREPEEALIHEASSTALQSQIHTEVDKDLHILQLAHSEADITPLQCVNHTEVQKDESPETTTDETTLPGPLNDAMAEPSSTHSKPETANSVASSTSLQSAKHSEVEKDFVTVGCDVYESNSPDSLNDSTTEPSGAHSKHEPENIVASSTPLQSAKDSETEKNPVTTGWDVSDNISPGSLNDAMTDPLDTHSKIETANSVASNTPLQSAKHSEVEKNLVTASSSDVSEGTPPGPITDAMAEPPSGTHSKLKIADSAASSTPLQSAKHSEVDEDPLTTSCHVSQSTPPGPITDAMTEPSSTHAKLETGNSVASSTPLLSAKHSEVDEDPLTASCDVSEGTPPGPITHVVTELFGTHSKEQHDERQSDPELDPWRPMLSQLHEVLIKPIVKFLPTKDENPRVTFIPQGFLLKVPFAALQGDARDHYIMQDFVISTSPAIHFLELACASRESAEHTTPTLELSLLAVGNPIMPYEELPQLPSAEHEVRMINEIINSPDSEVLIGERAKKSDVIRAMPKHNILHFATHAIIDDTDSHGDFSMKGLIFLAKSGLECNGTLTAEEVRGMELNAELVVLSCCDTGLGKVTGDGVLGLSRAFMAAGAACVIVTLWKIDDKSASELMTSFYREYKASRDAAVALQKAMKILQSNEDTRSPRHWAAFSIVGRATGV